MQTAHVESTPMPTSGVSSTVIRGSLQPPQRPQQNYEVLLNANLQGARQKQTAEQGVSITMTSTSGPEVRPSTTKYNATRTISTQEVEGGLLPAVGYPHTIQARNQKKNVFKTADKIDGTTLRRDGSHTQFSQQKSGQPPQPTQV